MTESRRPPLRFAVFCEAGGLNEFAQKCIRHITHDGLAEPVLLVVNDLPNQPNSFGSKIRKSLQLENLWFVQSKLFPPSRIPAYRSRPLDECLPGVDRIVCRPERKGKWSQYFTASDVEAIRSRNLDFILKFGFGIIRGAVLQAARLGVWSFHHDDEEKYRGGPPGFWEIYHGDPVTGALLQRLTDRLDGGVVLKKCYVPTDGRSYRANLQRIQECSWHMVRWACLDAAQGRLDAFEAPPSKTTAPIYRAPKDPQMLRFWLRLAGNFLRRKIANQCIEEWNAGIIRQPQHALLDPAYTPDIEWSDYRESGQMVADPFLLAGGDGEPPRILVEEFNWDTEKGRISELRPGSPSTIAPVIDDGRHMSYPYLFRHGGHLYAVPECATSGSILLYRLDPATGDWKPQTEPLLAGVDAVDATVFEHGGRWWLMYSGVSGCGPWSLYLCHADSPFGPWTPHPGNPVKTDISGARPAGNPFLHEGQLYRPAQDGRNTYGGALAIHRIDELTPHAFRETCVRRIGPQAPYVDGFHTLSGNGRWSVVDGKRHTWPLAVLLRRQLRKRFGLAPRGFVYRNVKPDNR